MNLNEAIEKASRILVEEQVQPTLGYRYVPDVLRSNQCDQKYDLQQKGLPAERKQRPRQVHENPKLYVFESTNFDLLVRIFSQVAETDRASFVSTLLNCVRKPFAAGPQTLALLAEFCIRTGHLKELLAATAEPVMPTANLAVMLKQIDEMIALNFNLFSDSELVSIPSGLAQLRLVADRQTYSARGPVKGPMKNNPHYRQGSEAVGNRIVDVIDGIAEECRKARHWYLKVPRPRILLDTEL